MGTSVLASEQEYLTTSYEPDCEYDEGVLLERNAGEQPRSILQVALGSFFFERRKRLRIRVLIEQRVRISPRKYRIPDVWSTSSPCRTIPSPIRRRSLRSKSCRRKIA
jgi:hypothetical protein